MNAVRRIMPQEERLQFFESLTTFGLLLVLLFLLSVYVISLPVKGMLLLTGACLFLNRERTFSHGVWPLLAIPLYGVMVSCVFPSARPDFMTIMERPLFTILCVLMASVVLPSAGEWRYRFLAFGILFACLIGAVGDSMGYDMTSLLPFTMPDEPYFDQVTMYKFGALRVRGFFPESGVLGAVSLGVATCMALGAWVLISQRRYRGAWWGLLISILIGGIMLHLTLTKTALFMFVGGLSGFLVFLTISRNKACRLTAVFGTIGTIAIAAAVFYAPGDLSDYFRLELGNALSLQSGSGDGGSLITRLVCWKLALYSVWYYPLGVGGWGLDTVLHRATEIVPTPEMRFFFDRDMFGLKTALANMVAETGLVGISILGFWIWWNFLAPAFRHLKSGRRSETLLAGLYGASAGLSLMFLFSCELYPSYALLLFFKLYADVVAARIEAPGPEIAREPVVDMRSLERVAI